jgi:Putative transposase, YhgA-like
MDGLTPENFDDFINHIYDKIFKLFFKHKPVAVDCLTHFVDKSIVDKLDLDRMKLKDTNFISKDLQEFFSDVIYETYLKTTTESDKKRKKRKARVVLIWEHKHGVESYFSLFVQILNYKVQQYMLDISENREPTLVIPIIVNQSRRPLKSKNFHDLFSHVPAELLIFVENFECYFINVHEIKQEILLKMQDDNLLRGLFLAYHAIESKEKKENALLEIFKFVKNRKYFEQFFQPLLAFIIKKGLFNQTEVKQMLDNYLTPNQKQNKMVAQLSLGDKWEAIGEARGEARGERRKAHLTVLRGYFRGQQPDLLADICGLPLREVLDLKTAYDAIKTAWQGKKVNTLALSNSTMLSEQEVKYVIECLDSL